MPQGARTAPPAHFLSNIVRKVVAASGSELHQSSFGFCRTSIIEALKPTTVKRYERHAQFLHDEHLSCLTSAYETGLAMEIPHRSQAGHLGFADR